MRILVDNSGYALGNLGDLAMLRVALDRFRALWPQARVQVLTECPDRLAQLCPWAEPLPWRGRQLWFQDGGLLRPFCRLAPGMERRLRLRAPAVAAALARTQARMRHVDWEAGAVFEEAVRRADLIVATGGGYVNDHFRSHAMQMLDTLQVASRVGRCAAMLGHGLGPISDLGLRANVAATFPGLDLITLREKWTGMPLLQEIGVPTDRVRVTGDDAIELAYRIRPCRLGRCLGVSIRVAGYSGVDGNRLSALRSALHRAAPRLGAPVVLLPISYHADESDREVLCRLLPDAEAPPATGTLMEGVEQAVRNVGRCRLVVTGSYHAGCFALAQGIPVIGLARSAYYQAKFWGLAEQFGAGCSVVRLEGDDLEDRIVQAVAAAWREAPDRGPELLAAAQRQIELGWTAYRELQERVAERRRPAGTVQAA